MVGSLGGRLKLVFSVDAIFPPLTGIGRYAWELASRFVHHPDIESIKFCSNGHWVLDPALLLDQQRSTGAKTRSFKLRPPSLLARQNWAVTLHRHVVQRMSPFCDHLAHGPNYFLPLACDSGIATVHDLSIFKFPETHPVERVRYFEREFEETLNRATHLITDTKTVRKEIIEAFNWPEEKITAIPLGVAPEFFPRLEEELIPVLDRFQLHPGAYSLCVSTLEPRKKIDLLLLAYQRLPKALLRAFPLVLIGSKGWLSDALIADIEQGQAAGWLRYLGYVEEIYLPFLYAGAKAFLYPSTYEGFGLPVLEAMASGVPVLTSNKSCLPEISGGAGLQVDVDDIEGLRNGIENVLTNESWRQFAIDHGLRNAQDFTWTRCAEQTLNVYRKMA